MRHFVEAQAIVVDKSLVAKAKQFARRVTPTVGTPGTGYRDTNQSNLPKVEYDHFISKIGEEAVRIIFQQLNCKVQGPDYQIYDAKEKSWDSDLCINDLGLAVKTQASLSAKKFGESWTFQSGVYRKDPILNQPDAWVCFVSVNDVTYQCKVYPPYQIKELKFGEPRRNYLKGSKKVVYAASLPLAQTVA